MNTTQHTVANWPLWKSLLSATAIGAFLFFAFILPAETGHDPTGLGEASGVTALAGDSGDAGVILEQNGGLTWRAITVRLEPYESLEIKAVLSESAQLAYDWRASGPLTFDFHGEVHPIGDEIEAYTFEAGDGLKATGAFTAPFAGEHGWFWENRGGHPVDLSLSVAGFHQQLKIYRDGFVETIAATGGETTQ